MRTKVFIAALMSALFTCAYAQDSIPPPDGRVAAEISTPNGNPVPNSWLVPEGGQTDLDRLNRDFLNLYSGYDSITAWSSHTYNCRGYAWHMTYDNKLNDPVVIWDTGEDAYLDDDSYVVVPFAFATRVVYRGHTAYVVSNADSICESKYGDYPRFTHKLTWLPDGFAQCTCYSRPIEIIFDEKDYTVKSQEQVQDVSKDTDFLWSVGPFIEIVSGQDSSHCSIRKSYFPGCQDTSWISVRLVRYGDTLNVIKGVSIVYGERPSITGPPTLCSSGGQFSISNVPSGATITWQPGFGIQRVSPQGSNPCTFRSISSGTTSSISAVISYAGVDHTVSSSNIWIGGPPVPTVVAGGDVSIVNDGHYIVQQWSSGAYFQMYPSVQGSVNIYLDSWQWSGANDMYVNGRYLDISPDNLGYNYVMGSQYNSCPEPSNVYFVVEVVSPYRGGDDGATLTLSPNPAGDYVDVRIDFGDEEREPPSYVMEILNSSMYPVRNAVLSGGYNRVSVQGLQRGYYVVRIRYGDTVLTKPLMVE